MAKKRETIPKPIKERLIKGAGNKCANPGCPNRRIEFYHIKQWAVYATNDEKHLVAVCPTCHDAIHNGDIQINDEVVYRWKGIDRQTTNRDQIYVEPGQEPILLVGRSAYYGSDNILVFELNTNNKLGFRLVEGDIFLVNLRIADRNGRELISVVDNYIRHCVEEDVIYKRVPGHISLSAPLSSDFLPDGTLLYLQNAEPSLIQNNRMTLFDLGVVEPGKVRIQGIWVKDEYSFDDGIIIISKTRIHQIQPYGPATVIESSVLEPTPVPGTNQVMLPLDNMYFGFGVPGVADEKVVDLQHQAHILEDTGDRDGAIRKLTEAVNIEPGLVSVHNWLSHLLFERGDIDAAIDAAGKFMYYSKNKAPALNNLGLLISAKGDIGNAIKHFRRSIALDPVDAKVLNNLAKALSQAGELDEALEHLQQAIEIDPLNGAFYNDLGILFAAKGDMKGAVSSFEKATALDPEVAYFYSNWGYVLENVGLREQAIVKYKFALGIDPLCTVAQTNLLRVLS